MDNKLEDPKPRRSRHSPLAYIGVFGSILVIIFIILLSTNSQFRSIVQPQKDQIIVMQTPPPTLSKPPVTSKFLTFQGCSIKKDDNPLIEGVRTVSGGDVIGTFYGNISQYNFSGGAKPAATLEITSPKAEQAYGFTVNEENGLVYDAIAQKDLTLNDLKLGQTVVVSFNCFPKLKNQFKITKISVVGK